MATLEKIAVIVHGQMPQSEYFTMSEDRKVITPENIGGLIEYPALFRAMQDDRELRPALSEAMSTGRAMNDFLTLTPEEFTKCYVVADGPVNPKTNKPYGTETKAYVEWRATQTLTPVGTEQFAMFGKMASAYNEHLSISSLGGMTRFRNVVVTASVYGVPCACKIDSLYVTGDTVVAVDVKTTDDLQAMARTADRLHYREQQALTLLVLASALEGANVQTRIAAIEKGAMPRCGVFAVKEQDVYVEKVGCVIKEYAESLASGRFRTRFEAPVLI